MQFNSVYSSICATNGADVGDYKPPHPFNAGSAKDALLPGHSSGMRFTAFGVDGQALDTRVFYSVGGGLITEEGEDLAARIESYPFGSTDIILWTFAGFPSITSATIARLTSHMEAK